ncbi:MAG: 3-methyl-2-oxobutanoate hydroxymethyltransferase [Thermodesulfovibrionales bacterium]|nr:3-methyl-2-oxobutanoate hydroxymethyltransferase [Thermodesulfovibrionales bacterium]
MTMRVSAVDIIQKKKSKEKITVITAYDYPFAKIVEESGIEVILVGDSLSMVVQGNDNTLPVTMDEMIYHVKMVTRATKKAMVIGDMPYMSYQVSVEQCLTNAGRYLKEAGANAIKLEGGNEVVDLVKALVKAEIPVMAHIGLTPQAIHRMGGYKVQGKTEESANKLFDDARRLEDAGAFCIVLEAIPSDLAHKITSSLEIPTIGIGAGPHCDGQVLVLHDVIGLFDRFVPRFVKTYTNIKEPIISALKQYKKEVEEGSFPSEEHSF